MARTHLLPGTPLVVTARNASPIYEITADPYGMIRPYWPFQGRKQDNGGLVAEEICMQILEWSGYARLEDHSGAYWGKSFASLSTGAFATLRLEGDILIPCAPRNLLVSVKSYEAKERLIVSGDGGDMIGFGFFRKSSEFNSEQRAVQYVRRGFLAIYMPYDTLVDLKPKAREKKNAFGRLLYRSIEEDFCDDIRRVIGGTATDL